jgi:glycosyltransferase involved in cell wall biosynthesis
MTDKSRVLVAGRPFDLSDARYDGFVARHRSIISLLAETHEVLFLLLRPVADGAEVSGRYAARVVGDVAIPPPPGSRRERVQQLRHDLRSRAPATWETAVLNAAVAAQPHAVVTLGPWLNYEYRSLFRRFPTLHLFEEDLMRMPDLAPQSFQGRLSRRIELFARRVKATQPDVVIAIGAAEVKAARHYFPRSRALFVPYTLDPHEWTLASTRSEGDAVVVVGELTNARNSDGLDEVLVELASRDRPDIKVRLVSGAGLHPNLQRHLRQPWVEHLPTVDDVRPLYRAARIALVPATRATGLKTTILQAWATGCPVVASNASAQTVGSGFSDALLAAGDAAGVVDQIVRLWDDKAARERLAQRGLAVMRAHFDDHAHRSSIATLVDQLASTAPRANRRSGG